MANQPDKVVTITLDPNGLPIPGEDPIEVKKDNQKIKWCAAFPFSIQIDGYPGSANPGTGGTDCPHNVKTDNFTGAVGTTYKYSITANGQVNDPDIVIKP